MIVVILVGFVKSEIINDLKENINEYFERDTTNEPGKSAPYKNPAPNNILNRADNYIISNVGRKYFDDHIYQTKSYVSPDENNIEYDYYSQNNNRIYPKYKIDYDYKFRIEGESQDTTIDFHLWLDKNGNLVDGEGRGYKYSGPQKQYSFSISRDEIINIARNEGVENIEEMKIVLGLNFHGDNGNLKESYIWHVTAKSPNVGTPEVVYIDVDTGEVIDTYILKENFGSVKEL